MFVFQWQFDEAQMTVNNVGAPVTPAQWNYIHHQGNSIRETFDPLTAVFSPSCISHTVITKPDWKKVSIEGVNLPDALQCWVSQTLPGEEPLSDEYIADKYAYRPNHYLRPLADSPQEKYKLNSNLVRSIDLDRHVDKAPKYTNSISHRIGSRNNLLDNRTKKRHNRRSKKRNKSCKYGDTLENRLKCVQEENERFLVENEVGTRNNRDLIRSLDTTRRKRRRRKRRRQVRLAGTENMTKEERRAKRREEKRRLKEVERRRRKARKRAERKRKREQEILLKESLERSRRKREVGGSCKTKHIDKCSWPQCNRSCPKLHNPLTGN